MSDHRKASTKQRRNAKRQAPPPETNDEFLAHGCFLEESAEKWRAGDSKKAARFYVRALETYDKALNLYPDSFDLSYNKARIQYSITQLPGIRANFPAPLHDLLETALRSHRQALGINPNNADLLFNTGQVLTSLADVSDDDAESSRMLQEAIVLFQQCLGRQESLYEENTAAHLQQSNDSQFEFTPDDGGVPLETEGDSELASQWATVIEPVTKSSLIDTVVAMLETLSSLCTVVSETGTLQAVEELSSHLLHQQLPSFLRGLDAEDVEEEVACASARFRANFSEAEFRLGSITYSELDHRIQRIFNCEISDERGLPNRSCAFLVCSGDALISFATAGVDVSDSGVLRFNRLAKALELLAKASKSPDAKDVASIHMGRGDAEMLRFCVCTYSDVPESIKNDMARTTLLQNAIKYYRGAIATAQSCIGTAKEIVTTAKVKQAVVECVAGNSGAPLRNLSSSGIESAEIQRIVTGMAEEALVQDDMLKGYLVL